MLFSVVSHMLLTCVSRCFNNMSKNHGYNTNATDSAGQEKQHDDDARTTNFGSGKWQLTEKSVHSMSMLEAECYHHNILQVTTHVQYKLPPNNDKSCYDSPFHVKNMQVLHLHLTRGSMSQARKQVLVLGRRKVL